MNESLDDKAVRLASDYLRTEGALLTVLMEMHRLDAFVELGYRGIWEYCVGRLRLSESQAYYFKSVAITSLKVPELQTSVVKGELTLSEARRIAPVITPANKSDWIEKARTLPQKELERAVTAVNPKAHIREKIRPVAPEVSEMRVPLDRTTEENIKVLTDILSQKTGKAATLAEVIAWATEFTREKNDPIRKASRARKPISSGKALVKHTVVKRDGNRCTFTANGRRCTQQRWLDVHHVIPRSEGGADDVTNLVQLCTLHHRHHHAQAVTTQHNKQTHCAGTLGRPVAPGVARSRT